MGNVSEPRASSKRILALSICATGTARARQPPRPLAPRSSRHAAASQIRRRRRSLVYVRSWSGSPRHALRLCVSLALCRGGLGTGTGRRSRRPHSSAGASATVTGGEVARCEIWGDMARYGETWRRSLEEVARCVVVERLVDIRLRGAAEVQPRCGRRAAEVRPRCSRGVAEVQPRCSRGAAEVQPRCGRGVAEVQEVQPRCSRGAAEACEMSSAMSVSHQPDVGRFCRNMTSSEKSIASSCLDLEGS